MKLLLFLAIVGIPLIYAAALRWQWVIYIGPTWRRRHRNLDVHEGDVCRYCGTTNELTVEHLTPRSRGGTNDPSNLGVSCLTCNQHKGPLREEEYLAVRHDQHKLDRLIRHQLRRIADTRPRPPTRRLDARSPLATRRLPRRRDPLVQRIPPISGYAHPGQAIDPMTPLPPVADHATLPWSERRPPDVEFEARFAADLPRPLGKPYP